MSNASDKKSSSQADVAQRGRLAEQFEIAKKIYAAHGQIANAPHLGLDRAKIRAFLEAATSQFVTAGGIARTGQGVLGDRGPNLCGENGDVFDYAIDHALGEKYHSAGIFALSA